MKISMKSQVVQQIAGAISWNFAGMLFSLVNGILTARLLDPDDRGLLALSLSISSLSYLVSSVGTNSAVRTLQPKRAWASFKTYLYVSAFLLLFNSAVVVTVILVFIYIGFVAFSQYVLVILVLGALTFTSNQLLDLFNAAGRTSASAFANAAGHFATMISLLLVAYALPGWAGLGGVLACYVLSYAARVCVMSVSAHNSSFEYGTVSVPGSRRFLRKSFKFWGIGLSRTLTFRADQFLLGLFSNAHQIGLYAVAVSPASLMQVVSISIGQVAYREAAMGRITIKRIGRFVALGLAISTGYAIAMWVLAPYLIPFVFGQNYTSAVEIVRILVVAAVILSPYSILQPVLTGLNSPYLAALSGIVGILALAPAMYLLAPSHGAVGAALSTTVSYASMLLVSVIGVTIRLRRPGFDTRHESSR